MTNKTRPTNKPERKDPSDEGYKSRAQMKREEAHISKLSQQLVELTEKQIQELPLETLTCKAILEAKKINSHIGMKRQIKFISKRLHEEDIETLEEKLKFISSKHLLTIKEHHLYEKWRDDLMANPKNAVFELLEKFPNLNSQQLRQLVRQANKEKSLDKPPKYQRELFKFLRENIEL